MSEQHVVDFVAAHLQAIIKRLITALVICIIVMLLNNAAWMYVWSMYDWTSESEEIVVEAEDGIANYIGRDGDITNGTDHSTEDDENP